ncbi:hypothetical protein VitviT2T_027516 [Vitis vinifera]|uniref:Uncharacterized protein n=1 Tax=Vitis vinifera TaxID=29760 RepID=A0ABY9DS09_VITVI|nr:hypothetical protein VitviT2T_027516 [Vitis vinifera]
MVPNPPICFSPFGVKNVHDTSILGSNKQKTYNSQASNAEHVKQDEKKPEALVAMKEKVEGKKEVTVAVRKSM